MRVASTLLMLGLLGCTKAGPSSDPITNSPPGAKPPPAVAPVTLQITAVTLGEDCGFVAAPAPAAPAGQSERKRAPGAERQADMGESAKRACKHSSMQLAITGAPSGSPQTVSVKKVELFDEKGTLIGELAWRNATVWSQDGTYSAWDQTVAASQALSVSFQLSAPDWSKVVDRYGHSFTVKAVLTVGGADRSVQREVRADAPAALPPDVET